MWSAATKRACTSATASSRACCGAGRHWFFDPLGKVKVEVVSQREPWLVHEKLDVIVKSGALTDRAVVLDLKDYERALVWIDGRFSHVLPPGLYAYWTTQREVGVEVVDARHGPLRAQGPPGDRPVGDGRPAAGRRTLVEPGQSACCSGRRATSRPCRRAGTRSGRTWPPLKVQTVDLRETMLDVAGQEIMTADKVTLRLNAVVAPTAWPTPAWRLSAADDARQALYREAQLALRAVIGGRELDQFLADKDAVATASWRIVCAAGRRPWAGGVSVGIRDVILPGEMKDLMNKVTEAKKAAEANLIARREETAAMRSPGQHGQAAGGQPDADAAAGAWRSWRRSPPRQAQRRAGREGPGRAGRQPAVNERREPGDVFPARGVRLLVVWKLS